MGIYSYIFGRYSKGPESDDTQAGRRALISSCTASMVVVLLFVLHLGISSRGRRDKIQRFPSTIFTTTVILGIVGYISRKS